MLVKDAHEPKLSSLNTVTLTTQHMNKQKLAITFHLFTFAEAVKTVF